MPTMQHAIITLKTRYETALQSDSDPSFYQNIHAYIDQIVKTPELSEIIDQSAKEYDTKHREIWGNKKCATDKEADEKEEQTHRLEQFSLYAKDYAFLYERIYNFIEEYKNHTEPDERPYSAAIIMLRGIGGIKTNLWSKKTLDQCSKMYTDKRKFYEDRLRRFHCDFLSALEKIQSQEIEEKYIPKEKAKPVIFIDDRKGIYQKFNEQSVYGVKKISKRFKIIKHLLTKDYCSISELSNLTHQQDHVCMKAISEINRLFREKAGQVDDLICHNDTVGYFLNKDSFEIHINQ